MNMGVDGPRKNLAFHIPTQADIVHRALGMGYADRILLDDRPFIEIGGDVMGGRADQPHPAFIGLFIRVGALERWQE